MDTPPVSREIAAGLGTPPDGLTETQASIWRANAPKAIEQRTLTDATLPGFREFCEQAALKAEIVAKIAVLGATTIEADRLLKRYEKLAQRVDATMARFKLTAFGKAETGASGAKKPASNPWAAIVGAAPR